MRVRARRRSEGGAIKRGVVDARVQRPVLGGLFCRVVVLGLNPTPNQPKRIPPPPTANERTITPQQRLHARPQPRARTKQAPPALRPRRRVVKTQIKAQVRRARRPPLHKGLCANASPPSPGGACGYAAYARSGFVVVLGFGFVAKVDALPVLVPVPASVCVPSSLVDWDAECECEGACCSECVECCEWSEEACDAEAETEDERTKGAKPLLRANAEGGGRKGSRAPARAPNSRIEVLAPA
ncbi:hypothetical protein B0H16DRAFT_180897 [Mycena metata]|uniref:Uncharacterized protein n=1 Tax=Mycena metata TaxID=1033252 RepID=A0AAD7MT70_9AGAR|nr:hypothetical protein B0H16DRAFT_180897 [Mycena metata]